MKQIVAFDFDGTITNRDTLLEFIKFAKGKTAFYLGFLLHLPWLLAMKCHLYPNWKTKQMIFSYFFKGVNLDELMQSVIDSLWREVKICSIRMRLNR